MTRPVPRGLLMVAFVAFVGLGVPDGLIGTGWPEMSGDLSRSIGDLGVAVTVGIAGFATMAALIARGVIVLFAPKLLSDQT